MIECYTNVHLLLNLTCSLLFVNISTVEADTGWGKTIIQKMKENSIIFIINENAINANQTQSTGISTKQYSKH